MMGWLKTPHGSLELPAYLPDATRAVVRSVDSEDLERCGIGAVVMNTFHLMQHPGSSTIQALGGLHAMAGWPHPIVTDSGGFQIYSLIHQNPGFGSLSNKGAIFKPEGSDRRFNLTPEKSVQLQLAYGADLLFCLDDCTHVSDSFEAQRASVRRTIDWARRSKAEFERTVKARRLEADERPLLFGVIQGGGYLELRKECAEALLEIGFDGFGYGGWPLDEKGNLLTDIIGYTRQLVPPTLPMHALGVAHPLNVIRVAALGYDLFDGALPTRDARHGRLYSFRSGLPGADPGGEFAYVYAEDAKHIKADRAISPGCDCPACTRYSLGYLHHLFEIKDTLAYRLATIHNLRIMARVVEFLREPAELV